MSVAPVVETAPGVSRPRSPYVGLVPYDEDDAAFFFGRSIEAGIVAMNLRASRLTVLYGPSGVGKTSLLMAGAVHDLHEEAARAEAAEFPFAVCVFRSWRDDPVHGLREAARAALQELAGVEPLPSPAATLAETLRAWTERTGTLRAWTERTGTLLVVLDQFEEYFQYHPDEGGEEGLTGFAAELARIVNDPSLPVHVLLSIREDAWAKLDLFKGHVPALFAHSVRVDHLDLDAAREAIEGPIEAWNRSLREGEQPFEIKRALVEAVLAATAGGGLTLTAGNETPAAEAPGDRVEAPFLQLVLERLWRDTVADGAHTLTLARLEALGGAARIVENHLLDALGLLTPAEQEAAGDCFRFLVSSDKTKIAHPAADLAEWTERPELEVSAVLDKLCAGESGRILRAIAPAQDEGRTSYELFHDILAEPIIAWRKEYELRRKQEAEEQRLREEQEAEEQRQQAARRRRRNVVAVLALVFLVPVLAGLTSWALLSRDDARQAEAVATSFALASASDKRLTSDPAVSLLLSLAAYRVSPTAGARSSMISALVAAQRSGLKAILHGVRRSVSRVAFSSDGGTLATVGKDGEVRLWDMETQTLLGQPLVRPRDTTVSGIALSANGETLAVARDDAKVLLWNVDPEEHTRRGEALAGPPGTSFSGVAFSPDGKTLATTGDDGTVQLWDGDTQTRLGESLTGTALSGLASRKGIVSFSPDGKTLATTTGSDGTVQLWNADTHTLLGEPLVGPPGITSLTFGPDGKTLATTTGSDGTVRLWNVDTHAQRRQPLTGPKGTSFTGVAFSPDGTLAAAGDDGQVVLWDVADDYRKLTALDSGHTAVSGVGFRPDGSTLNAVFSDGTVRLWNVDTHTRRGGPLAGPPGTSFSGVALSPDGKTLVATGDDGTVRLWDLDTHTQRGEPLAGPPGTSFSGVAFSPDGNTLAATGDDGTVRLWDAVRDYTRLRALESGQLAVNGVGFSPDGSTLAAAGADGQVVLWDAAGDYRKLKTLDSDQGSVLGVGFSPDGRTLAAAGADGQVVLWDAARDYRTLKPRPSGQSSVNGVGFSPDGRTLAAAGSDGQVVLWDAARDYRMLKPLESDQGSVLGVGFSPDGRTLAAAGSDGQVVLWDAARDYRKLTALKSGQSSVNGVGFSPDGSTLASGNSDSTVSLWEGILLSDEDALTKKVCDLVWGTINKPEWEEVAPDLAYHASCPD